MTDFNVADRTYYELPLNERTRTLLRLEHLFAHCDHHINGTSNWDDRTVISGLQELLNITALSDIKSELIKELETHLLIYRRLKNNPDVDSARLDEFLSSLSEITDSLHNHKKQFASDLRNNPFIKGVAQRATIPGGLCKFDVPFYHYWLERPVEDRQADLNAWLAQFQLIRNSVDVSLQLIRGSAQITKEVALNGLFQNSLSAGKSCRMVRVALSQQQSFYPEISGGKHRVNVRFVKPGVDLRSEQIETDVTFEFSRCIVG